MGWERYTGLTDEQVVIQIRNGEMLGIDYLLDKYKAIVKKKARALYLIGGEQEDLVQEGMIGLYHAIRDFDPNKEVTFQKFAQLCIARQMYTAIKASNRKKNIPLNTYVSLYTPVGDEENVLEDVISFMDVMMLKRTMNPEELVIDRENTAMLEEELLKRLSEMEIEVVKLYISGMKYTEIAEHLKKEPKSIDNALQRIRAKLNLILKEETEG